MTRDAAAIARASADAMWAEDAASRALGMSIETIEPGRAVLSMSVAPSMVNGHGLCHGGFIFLLADSAMAFASSTRNERTVAQHCQISYIAPGRLGMRLVAEARERHKGERSGIYDVTVKAATGETIAEFRGHTRTIRGKLVPEGRDVEV
ncbi:MAG TPA: hydroxyphenylacetyl-CoA thioesterase PaaI [Hyphomicrobiaceae bacterium]|nr:hydroxyphenylacetyl-CoA thioesterase PaaI [Hyphomicrobiaceae bacterium]